MESTNPLICQSSGTNMPQEFKKDLINLRRPFMQDLVKEQVFTKVMFNRQCPMEFRFNTFKCLDCNDSFIFKSSLQFHLNRRSMKIEYFCRICKSNLVFTNKCIVLGHMRSHLRNKRTFSLDDFQIHPLQIENVPNIVGKLNTALDKDPYDIDLETYLHAGKKNSTADIPLEDKICSIERKIKESIDNAQNRLENIFHEDCNSLPPFDGPVSDFHTKIDNNTSITKVNNISVADGFQWLNKPESIANCAVGGYHCKLCNTNITVKLGSARRHHFQEKSSNSKLKLSCKVCSFSLPNICALNTHKAIHLRKPPFICPECGHEEEDLLQFKIHLSYTCFHFARCMVTYCFANGCSVIIRKDLVLGHYLKNHTKLLFKCNLCTKACFTQEARKVHWQVSHSGSSPSGGEFYQCLVCLPKLIHKNNIKKHFAAHVLNSKNNFVYCCPGCNRTEEEIETFKKHVSSCKLYETSDYKMILPSDFFFQIEKYQKTCTACKMSFMYSISKLKGSETLPSECPICKNKDSFEMHQEVIAKNKDKVIKKLNSTDKTDYTINTKSKSTVLGWYNTPENTIQIVSRDMSITSPGKKMPIKESNGTAVNSILSPSKSKKRRKTSKRRNSEKDSEFSAGIMISEPTDNSNYSCGKCEFNSSDRELFHEHVVAHRDTSSAYQCMDCGLSFVVKTSFSSHLFISHGIVDIDTYIMENDCVGKDSSELEEANLGRTVNENQCQICLEQFDNSIDHDKHFRVHGMAFIKKQRVKPANSS